MFYPRPHSEALAGCSLVFAQGQEAAGRLSLCRFLCFHPRNITSFFPQFHTVSAASDNWVVESFPVSPSFLPIKAMEQSQEWFGAEEKQRLDLVT